ncbi:hypothetical protein POM88_039520 [Heracleum sosnowskyi]|uniref:PB1 domain-containing protein n=1 Tax=Heracleum sosnowskyi TaxID=360622 RepID=A0AAD8HCU6_9APIA|nr:hypothetical protein POM88_039520 [Heracleum sosnowskyi]
MQNMNEVTVKAVYRGVILRFELPLSSGMRELEGNLIERLHLEREKFSIKYQDEEGDWVLIACEKIIPCIYLVSTTTNAGEDSKWSNIIKYDYGRNITDLITITNTTNQPIDLWKVDIYDSKPKKSFTLSLERPPLEQKYENQQYLEVFSLEDRVVQPGKPLEIWLTCKPKEIGLHTAAVHVQIEVDEIIERVVFVLAEDVVSESLNCHSHYDFKLYRDYPHFLHLPPSSYQGNLLACKGLDEMVSKSRSCFNRFEASKTVEIIHHLTEKEVAGQDQIAVITPFKQHKLKIKQALRSTGMFDIKVGSVDQFQPRERQVVIASLVRSTMKYNDFDRNQLLGIVVQSSKVLMPQSPQQDRR